MTPSVAVLATLDTKGPEAAYLRDALRARGLTPVVVDCGILDPPLDVVPDVSSDEVARHSGSSIEQLRASGTRGRAVAAMRTTTRAEGILPALETSHAIAALPKLLAGIEGSRSPIPDGAVVLLGFSGRGDKDLAALERFADVEPW